MKYKCVDCEVWQITADEKQQLDRLIHYLRRLA